MDKEEYNWKKVAYERQVNQTPQKHYTQKYLTWENSFGYAKTLLAIRLRATYWTLQHGFKYTVADQTPSCQFCQTPVEWLDDP